MAETTLTDDTVSATAVVDATPAEVFDFIRRPANHPRINGDGTVRGVNGGPEVLSEGDRFNVSMKQGAPYRVSSKVVEFDQDRLIAWRHLGMHRWRWELEPTDDGRTRVTETFDMRPAPAPLQLAYRLLMKLPKGHRKNVSRSVDNVVAHFAG